MWGICPPVQFLHAGGGCVSLPKGFAICMVVGLTHLLTINQGAVNRSRAIT